MTDLNLFLGWGIGALSLSAACLAYAYQQRSNFLTAIADTRHVKRWAEQERQRACQANRRAADLAAENAVLKDRRERASYARQCRTNQDKALIAATKARIDRAVAARRETVA